MLTLEQLREIVITEGIASVKREFESYKLEGSIKGFEACRNLTTPAKFVAEILRSSGEEQVIVGRDLDNDSEPDLEAYWTQRYETIQIEYVYNVLRVGWGLSPISARAGIRYHEILQQHDKEESVGQERKKKEEGEARET